MPFTADASERVQNPAVKIAWLICLFRNLLVCFVFSMSLYPTPAAAHASSFPAPLSDTTYIYDTICSASTPFIWRGHSISTDTTICHSGPGNTPDTCLIMKVFPTFPQRPARPSASSRIFCQGQISQIQTSVTTPQVLWEVFPPGAASFIPPLQNSTLSLQWSSGYSGKVKITAKAQSICGTSPASDTLTGWVLSVGPGKLPRPLSEDSVLCVGEPFSLVFSDLPATQFLWALAPPNAGLISGDSANIRVNWNPGFTGDAFLFFNSVTPCGFKKSDSLKIVIKPNLPTSIDNLDTLYCQRPASVVLEGSPPGGQFFVNDSLASILPVSQAGIFSVSYRKEGCYLESTKIVRVKAPVQAQITGLDTLYCEGLSAQPMNGLPPNGIFEVNGVIQTVFQAPDSGIYLVSYRSFCSDTALLRVRIIPTPNPKIRFPGPGICQDSLPAPLQLLPAGGQLWVNGSPAISFIPASTGTYSLVYSVIADNCQAADTQQVRVDARPPLLINLENPERRIFCRRDTLVNVFGWPDGGYFSPPLSTANAFNPASLPAGRQKISYLDTNGACLDSASLDIRILEVPVVQAAVFSDSLCEGGPAYPLPLSQPAWGSWSGPGVSGNDFLPSSPGPFILSWNLPAIPDSTCAAFDTTVIFVRKGPERGPSGDTSLCSNEPLDWTVPGTDYRIVWQNGSESPTQIISEPGIYFYTASQAACTWRSDSLRVKSVAEPHVFSLGESRGFCPGDSFFLKGPSGMRSYEWSNDNEGFSGDSIFYPPEGGVTRLRVRNQFNCHSEQTIFLRKEECRELFIPDAFSPNGDGASDIWRIFGKNLENVSISVFNSWGVLVFSGSSKEAAWDGKFKGQDCPGGAYQYLIKYSGNSPGNQGFSGQASGQLFLIR